MNTKKFHTIVVHDMNAHQDDFLGAAIAVAYSLMGYNQGNVNPEVLRQHEIRQDQLDDAECLVMDKGLRYEPDLLNLDHHQDPKLDCAAILLLETLGIKELAFESIPSLRVTNYNDTSGMKGVATKMALPTDQSTINNLGLIFSNPIVSSILGEFSTCNRIIPGTFMYDILGLVGKHIITSCLEVQERHALLSEKVEIVWENGMVYADMLGLPADGTDPSKFFGTWLSKQSVKSIDFIVAHCPRTENAVRFVRYNDSIDFRKWADANPEKTQFCHKESGFLLVLNPGVKPEVDSVIKAVK